MTIPASGAGFVLARPVPFSHGVAANILDTAVAAGLLRAAEHPQQPWERIRIHPRADREKITALKADMMRTFVTGDLDTYWRLDHESRWVPLLGAKANPGLSA